MQVWITRPSWRTTCAPGTKRPGTAVVPQQITRVLSTRCGSTCDIGGMSQETIFKTLYVQGRGELRRELARCLKSGRAAQSPQGQVEPKGQIRDIIMISERPAGASNRAVPGHWEGDLLVGKDGKSHIATLVERSTRYVLLAKIPNAKAETVAAALVAAITRLPQHLWRSLTWDKGKEMTQNFAFTIATDIRIYFCDPHNPWKAGSNENTNGLLRQYFPKDTSLRNYSQEDLDRASVSLNGRPRKTLEWNTPAECLVPLLVATTLETARMSAAVVSRSE
jgi:IS30 family transposase